MTDHAVLVTGATGFVGREIVRRLLARGRPVVAVARARDGETASERVAAAVAMAVDGRDLDVVDGDLRRPGVLDAAVIADLAARVETVFHCAGDTTFWPDDLGAFHAGHVAGPLALLGALARGQLRRWLQFSTAYVCGRRTGLIRECEDDVGQAFSNPYERAKLEAEIALRQAGAARSVDVRVLRPSVVVGPAPATAGGAPANLFFRVLRLLTALAQGGRGRDVRLRIEAAPAAPFNIVPIDYVAAAAVILGEHPAAEAGRFHLVAREAPAQADVLAMIAARLGLRGVRLVEHLDNPSPLEVRVHRMIGGYREYLGRALVFDDAASRLVLDRCGIERPSFSPRAIGRLIDQAVTPVEARVAVVS